jgi:hypothetical protein
MHFDTRPKLLATFHTPGGHDASAFLIAATCLDELRAMVPMLAPGTRVYLHLDSIAAWGFLAKPRRRFGQRNAK